MSTSIRSTPFFYYRAFFIGLFLLMGVTGICFVSYEVFNQAPLVETDTAIQQEALFATMIVMAVLGSFTSLIMIFLMQERRGIKSDRRQYDAQIAFSERRLQLDRRA